MISLIFAIIFLVIFIFFVIAGGNYLLKSVVDHVLNNSSDSNEGFANINHAENIVNPTDSCKKIDFENKDKLNFQTATNIPLSPNYYKDYVGVLYTNETDMNDLKNNLKLDNTYCLKKSKLLYDGIWDDTIKMDGSYVYNKWSLTDGDVSDDFYCSNKLIEINIPMPTNFVDMSATPTLGKMPLYEFVNDPINDVNDTELICFDVKDIDYPIKLFT
jgi:hypothetical protein